MAEKKKMSVAEILAAARKKDSKSGEAEATPADAPAAPIVEPTAVEPVSAEEKPAAKPAAAKPAVGTAGKRPSVAEMMALARANKPAAAAEAPKAKPAPKPAAAKQGPKPEAGAKPVAAAKTGEKDTASILAAARSGHKPGPITKAEAATMAKPAPPPAAREGKAKLVAPPMPAKPAAAQKKPAKAAAADEDRRGFLSMALGSFLGLGFVGLTGTTALWSLGTARFMFPNILTEPPSTFKVGPPSDFPPGAVSDKFKAQFGVWVVNGEYNGQSQVYALRTVCTHLGCTPNWLEAEQKFKCPCHGSGFYKDGINFEGPAPRPLERYAIRISDDGQVEIDKSKKFQEELGQWSDTSSFVPV